MIEEYLDQFEACLVGTDAERAEWRAELASHLQEAHQAGDLEGALARLGAPRDAAAAFSSAHPLAIADVKGRARAAMVDYSLVVAVTAAIIVEAIVNSRHNLAFSIPPPLGGSSSYPLWRNIAVPLVLLVTWVGLSLIEATHGHTPGKALVGLRTVSSDGTPITRQQALTRNAAILAGPLLWVDAVAMLVTEKHQRLLDLWAHTIVIDEPRTAPTTAIPGAASA